MGSNNAPGTSPNGTPENPRRGQLPQPSPQVLQMIHNELKKTGKEITDVNVTRMHVQILNNKVCHGSHYAARARCDTDSAVRPAFANGIVGATETERTTDWHAWTTTGRPAACTNTSRRSPRSIARSFGAVHTAHEPDGPTTQPVAWHRVCANFSSHMQLVESIMHHAVLSLTFAGIGSRIPQGSVRSDLAGTAD
jgi:hypothetical protein